MPGWRMAGASITLRKEPHGNRLHPRRKRRYPPDLQGDGQSVGVPADGELEGSTFNPLGDSVGMKHWQAGYIEEPGF